MYGQHAHVTIIRGLKPNGDDDSLSVSDWLSAAIDYAGRVVAQDDFKVYADVSHNIGSLIIA